MSQIGKKGRGELAYFISRKRCTRTRFRLTRQPPLLGGRRSHKSFKKKKNPRVLCSLKTTFLFNFFWLESNLTKRFFFKSTPTAWPGIPTTCKRPIQHRQQQISSCTGGASLPFFPHFTHWIYTSSYFLAYLVKLPSTQVRDLARCSIVWRVNICFEKNRALYDLGEKYSRAVRCTRYF